MTTMISKEVKNQLYKQGWTNHQINYIVNNVTEYVTPGVDTKINASELEARMKYLDIECEWRRLASSIITTLH